MNKNFNVDISKIAVVPHGNFDVYQNQSHTSASIARTKLKLSDDDDVLLFFGFIRRYKGLDILLDAFEKAQTKNNNLKLVIAGAASSEQLENEYQQRIKQISQNGNIIFHSEFIPVEQVATYFVSADVVALPYKNIFHSGLMHLAYSFGKPIIATNVGDFEETIEHGKSGFVLKNNDATDLSQTIGLAFSNKTKLTQMGNYAKELSKNKYSWENVATLTKKQYEKIS